MTGSPSVIFGESAWLQQRLVSLYPAEPRPLSLCPFPLWFSLWKPSFG